MEECSASLERCACSYCAPNDLNLYETECFDCTLRLAGLAVVVGEDKRGERKGLLRGL